MMRHPDCSPAEVSALRDRCAALERDLAQARQALEERAKGHIGDELLRNTLVNHFPVELRCDHETSQDMVICDCATVNLGWHPSVRRAKEAWARHVEEVAKTSRLVAIDVAREALVETREACSQCGGPVAEVQIYAEAGACATGVCATHGTQPLAEALVERGTDG